MTYKIFLMLALGSLFGACTATGDDESVDSVLSVDEEEDTLYASSSSIRSNLLSSESLEAWSSSSVDVSRENTGTVTSSCPSDYPLLDEHGDCHSCSDDNIFRLKDEESCELLCDGKNGTTKRVNNFWGCKLGKCPDHKPLEDYFGECRSCDYDDPIRDTVNCSLCPNRKVQDGYCLFASCADRPLMSYDGFCYPCSTEQSVETLPGECQSACPNRRENGSWSYSHGLIKDEGVFCVKD